MNINNIVFILLIALGAFVFELMFIRFYAPNGTEERDAFLKREIGKAIIGFVGCLGFMAYYVFQERGVTEPLSMMSFVIGVLAAVIFNAVSGDKGAGHK